MKTKTKKKSKRYSRTVDEGRIERQRLRLERFRNGFTGDPGYDHDDPRL